jgi:pimeloyl-ACP methyl ester carboxylesterase
MVKRDPVFGLSRDMQPREVRALGELAGEAVGGMAARIEELHEGIAKRAFDGVGALGSPIKLIHDRIAHDAYNGIRAALSGAVRSGARIYSLTLPADTRSLERTPAGRLVVGALNGAFGDRLLERGNALAQGMTVRRATSSIAASEAAGEFPDATAKLAVFVHGLCETEDAWFLGARLHRPYGMRLQVELGYTPIYVRYNSGRHVSENGRELARLLDELVDTWPVAVEEIALIGHSMGGLVARCACHAGAAQRWAGAVRHVFMLGTPHRGAPLEKAANAASERFALLPETRPLASALNLRSVGIKDLGHDCEVPFLRTANHYFVSATLSREPTALAGRLVGDLLVLPASAWDHGGRGQRLRFPIDNYRHLGQAHHFDLLNHPAIYVLIRTWLGGRLALPASVPADTLSG